MKKTKRTRCLSTFPRLVGAEAAKLLTPFTLALSAALLLIEVCFTVFYFRDSLGADGKEIRAARETLLSMYLESRSEYDELSADFDLRCKEYDAQLYRRLDDDRVMPSFQNELIDLDAYGDRQLFSDVRKAAAAPAKFRETLTGTLVDVAARLREIGSESGYLNEYYLKILKIYDPLAEKELPVTFVDGWGELFGFQAPAVFAALACLVLFSRAFTLERGCGTDALLRVSKLGGSCTDAAKIVFTSLFSVVVTVVFSIAPFAVFLLSGGLSAADVPIQCVSGMTLCPLNVSIRQYFVIFLTMRVIGFLCFSLIVAASGRISGSAFMGFAAAGVLAGIGMLLGSIPPSSYVYPLSAFNPISLVTVGALFDRYHGTNFFGHCVNVAALLVVLAVVLTLLVCAAAMIRGAGRSVSVQTGNASKRRKHGYSMSLFRTEFFKIFTPGARICVAAALFLKCFLSLAYYMPPESSDEAVFREYMELFSGEITAEKLSMIENERVYIEKTLAEHNSIIEKYSAGELSGEEYSDHMSRYNYAKYCENACKRLIERRDFLVAESAERSGVRFFYDRGVRLFVTSFPDVAAIFCLMVLTGRAFAVERGESASGGFSFILRAAYKGRRVTFFAKYLTVAVLTAAIYVLFTGVDVVASAVFYGFPGLETGIASVPDIASPYDMTILAYALARQAIGLLGFVFTSVFITSLSVIVPGRIQAAGISLAAILLPYAGKISGAGFLEAASFADFCAPEGLSLLPAVVCVPAALAAFFAAYRKWNA